jgi:hypothetical protein
MMMRNQCWINGFILSTIGFISLAISYIILNNWFKHPIATLYRMYGYQNQYPFQYIGIVAVSFGAFGSLWIKYFGLSQGWRRGLTMTVAMLATIIVSSPMGGVLWHIHDMQAGFMPSNSEIARKITSGIGEGLSTGWLIALLSFPFNLIGTTVGFGSLQWLSQRPSNR